MALGGVQGPKEEQNSPDCSGCAVFRSMPCQSPVLTLADTLFASGLLLTGPFYSRPRFSRARCPLIDRVECRPGRLLDRIRQTTPGGRLSGSAISPTQAAGFVASLLRY